LKSLDEKPQAATPTHPTTTTALDAGPQLDITQLATEPVPDKPKPEIIYVSRWQDVHAGIFCFNYCNL